MERFQYLVKVIMNVALPIVDIGTDINFTLDMYYKYDNFTRVKEIRDCYNSQEEDIGCIFKLSVLIMMFPILTSLSEVITSSTKRWIIKEYLTATFNQISELIWESYHKLILQQNVAFNKWNQSIISMDLFIPILSITVSAISVTVGVTNFNLRNILGKDPTFLDLFRFFLSEQFSYYPMFFFLMFLLNFFIKYSFLNKNTFYIGISIYFFLSIFLPKLMNMICKFPIKFESHMLICFPNYISSCYRNCNKISEYQFYRQMQLVHSLIMSTAAIYLNNNKINIFRKLHIICKDPKALELVFKIKYVIDAVLGFSSLLLIVEIICIQFGVTFIDFAFKKACEDSSTSVSSEVNQDCKREDAEHMCTLDIKIIKKSKEDTF